MTATVIPFTEPPRAIVVHDDGTVTVQLTHEQLLALETFAAQPWWRRAAREAARALAEVGL